MSLQAASRTAQAAGLQLQRAVPRRSGHLLVELTDTHGARVAGQWFDDPAEADRAAHGTARAAEDLLGTARAAAEAHDSGRAAPVQLLAGRLLLQPGGADRRLPALRALLAQPNATLVAHRPERRAVVRLDADPGQVRTVGAAAGTVPGSAETAVCYSKVVRPDRIGGVLAGLTGGRAEGLRTPAVVDVDRVGGVVTTRALPGRTLHDLLTTGTDRTSQRWWRTGVAVGAGIGLLHGAAVGPATAAHDATAELAVCRRWLDLAAEQGLLDRADPAITRAWTAAVSGLGGRPPVIAPVHRDLHDKQLLIDGGGGIGVLDLDLLAAGDPALDLANLLVHLELRVRQGVTDRDSAAACAAGLLAGHRNRPGPWIDDAHARLTGYAWATRLRLLAVYAFRPSSAAAARLLVTDPEPLVEECV